MMIILHFNMINITQKRESKKLKNRVFTKYSRKLGELIKSNVMYVT